MTSHASQARPHAGQRSEAGAFVGGWTVFAAVLMIFGGLMAVFAGIAAIANDDVFVNTRNYVYQFDLTGWGWVHMILGVVVFMAGCALFQGATWARVVGVALAGLSMLANFLWLPYTPFWALALITINGFVIWALCAPRNREA